MGPLPNDSWKYRGRSKYKENETISLYRRLWGRQNRKWSEWTSQAFGTLPQPSLKGKFQNKIQIVWSALNWIHWGAPNNYIVLNWFKLPNISAEMYALPVIRLNTTHTHCTAASNFNIVNKCNFDRYVQWTHTKLINSAWLNCSFNLSFDVVHCGIHHIQLIEWLSTSHLDAVVSLTMLNLIKWMQKNKNMLNLTMNSVSVFVFQKWNGNRNNEDWRRKRILTYGCNVHRTHSTYNVASSKCKVFRQEKKKKRRKVRRNGNWIAFVENAISFLKYDLQELYEWMAH